MVKNGIVCFGEETARRNATTLKSVLGSSSGEDGFAVRGVTIKFAEFSRKCCI
jgi:hypothetical protein